MVPPALGVPSAVSAAPAPVSYADTSHEDNPKAAIGPSVGALADAPTDRAAGLTLDTIERLAGLRDRGVLSEAEFIAKKTELLGRL
jgi:hypothetical protein